MGMNGSDVAREAGDIVLLDDNFASIVVGIKEGRLLFANLKKSVAYTLAHLVPEILPVILWAFVGIPQAMGTLFSVFVDLFTELAPSSAFAYEKEESLIMLVPPRNTKTDKLLTLPMMLYAYLQTGLMVFAGCFYVYFITFQEFGVSAKDIFYTHGHYFNVPQDVESGGPGGDFYNSEGRRYTPDDQNYIMQKVWSAWYLQIVIGQAIHFFPARTIVSSIFEHGLFCNWHANWAMVISICLGVFITYCPGFQTANQGLNPLSLPHLYASLWLFGAIWGWTELRKWFTRNFKNTWVNKNLVEY